MRLFTGRIPAIASDIVRTLLASSDIEASSPKEVQADIEAVLRNYLAMEKEVNDRTRELLERTGRGSTEYSRVREQIAQTKGIKVGDEMLDYLLDQVVEIFQHSANVEEIFVEDVVLRRKMAPIFKKQMQEDDALDGEVRGQLKHLTEGTRAWEVEYAKTMEQIRRKKGL